MFKLDLENTGEPEIKLPTPTRSSQKHEFQKNLYFCFIHYTKAFDYGSQQTVENSSRDRNTTLPAPWEICMQLKKQQLELDMEQTGSKLGKEYIKAVNCHPAYLAYMQSTSLEMPDWMKHKLEAIFRKKYE